MQGLPTRDLKGLTADIIKEVKANYKVGIVYFGPVLCKRLHAVYKRYWKHATMEDAIGYARRTLSAAAQRGGYSIISNGKQTVGNTTQEGFIVEG